MTVRFELGDRVRFSEVTEKIRARADHGDDAPEVSWGPGELPTKKLWSLDREADRWRRDEQVITPDAMTVALRAAFRAQVAADLPATAYAARLGPAELLIRVDGPSLAVTRGDGPADLAFAAGPDIRRVISGLVVGTSTSPLPYHLNRCSKPDSFGPAM